jgi:hypothetical protein
MAAANGENCQLDTERQKILRDGRQLQMQQPATYKLRAEIGYILDAAGRYATNDGRLMRLYDASSGAPVDMSSVFEDFGDVAPFLFLAGKQDLAASEFDALRSTLESNRAYVNPQRSRQWLIHTYDWTDLLLGLMEYYCESHRAEALNLADDILGIWVDKLCRRGVVYGRGVKLGRRVSPLPLGSLIDIGMLPELLITRAGIKPEPRNFDPLGIARDIVLGWISEPFFGRNGLFPNVLVAGPKKNGLFPWFFNVVVANARPKKTKTATLFKHNTNAIASILAVWKITKERALIDAIEHWTDGCRTKLKTNDGRVAMQWVEGEGIVSGPTDHNFQVIDLMCDIAHETEEQSYLDLALSVAKPWLERRGRTGLIPHRVEGKYATRAMSDSQTDFAVALLKLESLTGNDEFGRAAEEIMEAVKRHMYMRCGMATWVDVDTGDVVDSVCKTKFFVLSIKAWLALANRERMYRDERFTSLLSDR